MSFITLDSVSAATPDGRLLFENLNLSIGAERIGLVGRNGAGKSTLLALIAGARPPWAGSESPGREAALCRASHPSPAQLLAFAPGKEQAAGVWEP